MERDKKEEEAVANEEILKAMLDYRQSPSKKFLRKMSEERLWRYYQYVMEKWIEYLQGPGLEFIRIMEQHLESYLYPEDERAFILHRTRMIEFIQVIGTIRRTILACSTPRNTKLEIQDQTTDVKLHSVRHLLTEYIRQVSLIVEESSIETPSPRDWHNSIVHQYLICSYLHELSSILSQKRKAPFHERRRGKFAHR